MRATTTRRFQLFIILNLFTVKDCPFYHQKGTHTHHRQLARERVGIGQPEENTRKWCIPRPTAAETSPKHLSPNLTHAIKVGGGKGQRDLPLLLQSKQNPRRTHLPEGGGDVLLKHGQTKNGRCCLACCCGVMLFMQQCSQHTIPTIV